MGFDYLFLFDKDKAKLVPSFYPTAQSEDGYVGHGAVMVTKETGSLGVAFGSPIAAGSLYLGNFVLNISNTVKSTRFGQPYTYEQAPKSISGYFRYKAGEEFVVNKAPSTLTKDTWDAYGILFEKTESDNFLTGDHNFEDSRIVSYGRITDEYRIETDDWKPFDMSFEYVDGKTFDPEKEYMFTIVFSSSMEGAIFNAALGSTLHIDEVQITLEDDAEGEE